MQVGRIAQLIHNAVTSICTEIEIDMNNFVIFSCTNYIIMYTDI